MKVENKVYEYYKLDSVKLTRFAHMVHFIKLTFNCSNNKVYNSAILKSKANPIVSSLRIILS